MSIHPLGWSTREVSKLVTKICTLLRDGTAHTRVARDLAGDRRTAVARIRGHSTIDRGTMVRVAEVW